MGHSVSQAGRQAGTHLPSGEGGSSSQAGSQASQFQAVTSQLGRQAGALLPSWEGGSFSQTGSQASQAFQAVTHLTLGRWKQLSGIPGFPDRCSPSFQGRKQAGRCSPAPWFQRFAGKVNDPLRVGVFWGRPLRESVRCEIGIPGARAACLRSSPDALGSLEGPLPG